MALSAQCAQAAPALATKNVNLRQGPGTSYPVISTIPGGSTVEIGGCQGRWCTVAWQGQNGYAIATSFDQGGGGAPPGAGGPPPGTTAGGPPGAPPPGYPQGYPPPPGYAPPPGYYPPGYYPPGYYDPYGPYYGYGPYWRRRWW
jgi:hypothetical protein